MTYLIEPLHGEGSQRERERTQTYEMLCRLVGGRPELSHADNGAPFLPAHRQLCISISHCRKAVAVAVGDGVAVGIDVESRRRVSQGLIEKVCTAEEQEAIRRAADPEMEFLRFWTYGSMLEASTATDCTVVDVDCGLPDVVAAVATAKA